MKTNRYCNYGHRIMLFNYCVSVFCSSLRFCRNAPMNRTTDNCIQYCCVLDLAIEADALEYFSMTILC